jgi:transposase-like protein
MMHRIRLAMHTGSFKAKFGGNGQECEVDETFIGGKARNMHKSVRDRRITGRGHHSSDKAIVMGILERGKEVRTQVVPNRVRETVQPIIREHVAAGSALFTDEMSGYRGMPEFTHQIIDHAVRYVDGVIHTNGMENFWSLTKRTLGGTYVSVEPFHLFRYLSEQEFRYNNRGNKENPIHDGDRFRLAMSLIVGKRLTYEHLTGKDRDGEIQPF